MNKLNFPFLLFLTTLVGGTLYFTDLLQSPFIRLNLALKTAYLETVESIENKISEHFSQQRTIIDLRAKNRYYEQELLTLHQIADEYQKLLNEHNSTLRTDADVELVRAISYVRFGDPHKLWLEVEDFNESKVYGLLHRGYAAGIAVSQGGRPMALLNSDPKCSYAVTIGDSTAPGIIRGNSAKRLVVEYIPTWIPISVGDEVVTSGLDRIFLSGMKVGKVVSITKAQGYQSAVVEPYIYGKNPAYFHVITKVR